MRRGHFLALGLLAVAGQLVGLYSPGSPEPSPDIPGLDKVIHLLIFFVPAWLLLRAGIARPVVIALFAAQALVSEYAQSRWIRNRGGDPLDALADFAGIGLGVWLTRSKTARAGRDSPTGPRPDAG